MPFQSLSNKKQKSLVVLENEEIEQWVCQKEFFYMSSIVDSNAQEDIYRNYLTFDFKNYGYRIVVPSKKSTFCFLSFATSCLRNCLFCSCRNESIIFAKIDINQMRIDLRKIKRQLKHVLKIFIVSPEPFVHSQFLDMVKLCANYFKQVECYGCVEFLADFNQVALIEKSGITHIQLGLYSSHPEIHDFIVGRKGNFDLVIKSIENLRKTKINVFISSILMKFNANNLIEDQTFVLKELKLPYIVTPLRQRNMDKKEFISLMPTWEQIKDAAFRYNFVIGFPLCLGRHNRKAYGIKATDLSGIAKFALYFTMRDYIKLNACKTCRHASHCPGVIKEYLKFYPVKDFLAPF